jgi:uncharacterized membrane protein
VTTERTEAFSDGVFAIAITLLVLEIAVPRAGRHGLAQALADQWPAYLAYAVSFLIIGIIWVNHHAVFSAFERVDRGLLMLNLLLLAWVALIPWPTSLIATYMRDGGSDEQVAALVYAGTMAGMGVSFSALWIYGTRRRRLVAPWLSDEQIRVRTARFVVGAPLYLLAMAASWIGAVVSLAMIGVLAIYYALTAGGAALHPSEADRDATESRAV